MTEMFIAREFQFSAAHKVRFVDREEDVHGHNYEFRVTLKGVPDEKYGVIFDVRKIKNIVDEKVVKILDDRLLDDIIKKLCRNPKA